MSNFFAYSNNFWEKSIPFDSEKVQPNHFTFVRIASFHRDGIYIANIINRCPHLPQWAIAGTLYYGLPQRRAIPKRLPKTTTKKLKKKDQKILDLICNKFNVSEIHGKQIVSILEKQGFNFGI